MTAEPYFPSVFDSSMLSTWKSCQTLFKHIYLEDWKSKGENVHRHAGKAFATALETARTSYYVDKQTSDSAVAAGLAALVSAYGDFQCPPDSAKSLERMCGAYEFYFDNYPLNESDSPPITLPSGRRGIEFSFAHPLPILHPVTGDPILYCGRMDAILQYAGGVYNTDEKTASSLGPSWSRQWDLRAQFTGYAWGAREAGIRTDGTIIRGISILKTKYETQQAIVMHPAWQIHRWYEEMLDTVNEIVSRWRMGYFKHNLDSSCADYGGCAFRIPCLSQDPTPWLETSFEKRRWNPLMREEVAT
jgi:hypothetical protein